ncbi:LytR/AlgR family response regulator transcription factor [Acetivibrio cellulolyticus]|uniref:LytR/AlgR family response regulator transcription factor n=1 Tax=Acetivibrio cellulolyticus TaxID=35830 RepID=UPI0001E2E2A8|nr:response regulator [Acetivibrio cellulolyticus]
MIKAVIVDDEFYALEGLHMELEDMGGIEVQAMYENGMQFLKEASTLSPDIVFLDIEMPGLNGFELLEKLMDAGIRTNVVFVTAYNHYAVQAFEINAIDYIVKPATKFRLAKTLERIKPGDELRKTKKMEVRCFRHFSILVDGNEINTGWRTRKAEELIAFLLCEKGEFVSKEKIAEALWPETDGEKGVSNLYLAYYYIKKQENINGIRIPVESERGKMRINLEDIDCDMLVFDKYAEKIDDLNGADRIAYLEKTVRLYKGTVFEDRYYSWTVSVQQQYEMEYVKILNSLKEYYENTSDIENSNYYTKKLNEFLIK